MVYGIFVAAPEANCDVVGVLCASCFLWLRIALDQLWDEAVRSETELYRIQGASIFVCSRAKAAKVSDFNNFTGWWFGCHVLFSHILGMSSSQLTLIFFRGVAQPPTSFILVHFLRPDLAVAGSPLDGRATGPGSSLQSLEKRLPKTGCHPNWLVVWNIFYFPIYWEIIIPID